jgi:hypothetical protein
MSEMKVKEIADKLITGNGYYEGLVGIQDARLLAVAYLALASELKLTQDELAIRRSRI